MSVVSDHDELRYELKLKIRECLKICKELNDDETCGYKDLNEETQANYFKMQHDLMVINSKL